MKKNVGRVLFHYFFKSLLPICIPLIPYTFLLFIKEFGDRWILQTWGGEKEQAYFGVSERFTMLVMICTSSILRVIWKEFAESNYKEDSERVFLLFKKSTRSTYFFCCLMAAFFCPLASDIIKITLNTSYFSSISCVTL